MTLLIVIAWVAAVVAAILIGDRKGRHWTGLLLGVLLGWIGVIIIALIPPTREELVERERKRQEIERKARG